MKKKYWLPGFMKMILIPILIIVCLLALMFKGVEYFEKVDQEQSLDLLEQSVRKATIECYAVEGVYPSELDYLVKNYGVRYDKEKYDVEYGCYANNIMPTIVVYEKQ